MIAALALTAVLLPAALAYVGAYARVARNEYRRQQLLEAVRDLERQNAQLRLQADAARAGLRPAELAQAYDLSIANPSTQVDYVRIPQPAAAEPPTPAKARLAAVASWVVALVTFEARAQASTLQAPDKPQAGPYTARPFLFAAVSPAPGASRPGSRATPPESAVAIPRRGGRSDGPRQTHPPPH